MKHNRKLLCMLLTLLAIPLFAAGAPAATPQGSGPGGGGRRGPMSPDEQLKRMTKDLDLTSDEQAKIKPILVDEQKKMEDLRNDSGGDRQAMREKMMQIRQDHRDHLRAVLDDKQKKKFDKQEQQREERMQGRRGGGSGGPGGQDGPGGANPGNDPPPQN